jgi:hypothetical protein
MFRNESVAFLRKPWNTMILGRERPSPHDPGGTIFLEPEPEKHEAATQ